LRRLQTPAWQQLAADIFEISSILSDSTFQVPQHSLKACYIATAHVLLQAAGHSDLFIAGIQTDSIL
jgi:hypothetical protein